MFCRRPINARFVYLALCVFWIVSGNDLFAEEGARQRQLLYESHVAPILKSKCVRCHDAKLRKGALDLSTVKALLKGGESGPVFETGKADDSLLYELISGGDMPPDKKNPLSSDEVEIIRQWISSGAKFRDQTIVANQVTDQRITALMLLRCTACHGGRRTEAELDLRNPASMLRGGKSGPAVVPGKPEDSLIIKRIRAGEMPPRRQLVSVSVKPMESAELELLETWIRHGMPASSVFPDVATGEPDRLVTTQDRQFWSFRPPQAAPVPKVKRFQYVRNPIDAFILRKLDDRGLSFSAEADRSTLLRRAYFDLIGLPPEPEEVERFLTDNDPLAYERLVDRLLASPHYGERWGRHWLDAAGYADSEGAQNEDRVRPHMWRYRDYVIRSFNQDKTYDQFLHEQIAGDEMVDYESAETITPEIYDKLVATGFLRTAPDRTFANITNFVPDRLEVIADEIQIFGSAVLGLTINCARCHSHKFDPIPQRDYYRLAAAFKDALDEHDWLKSQGPRTLPHVLTLERHDWELHNRELTQQIDALKKQLKSEKDDAKKKQLEEQIKMLEGQRKPEPRIRALWSRGEPSPTYILRRGNYLTPGREVGPGVPSILTDGKTPFAYQSPWPGAKKTGRRLALARSLTEPTHPLTARVMVNRIWKHHFGTGLVASLDNFGKTGQRPSHPELLDWLAVEFMRNSWSIKAIHRLILNSSAYRQSSKVTAEHMRVDPDGRLLSHMPLVRMEAEVLRDSLLRVAGQLDPTPFGPPDEIEERGDGLITAKRSKRGWRRSIFVLQRRTKIPTLLENYDYPQMGPNCVKRNEAVVAPQALHLMNNAMVHQLAKEFAERVRREAGVHPPEQVERVFLIAYGRQPTDDELELSIETLQDLTRRWTGTLSRSNEQSGTASRDAEVLGLTNYCHAIMNSAAFLYID